MTPAHDAFTRWARRISYNFRRLDWVMKNKPITPEEEYAFKLAMKHIRLGRTDLAAEDLEWLGRRYGAA